LAALWLFDNSSITISIVEQKNSDPLQITEESAPPVRPPLVATETPIYINSAVATGVIDPAPRGPMFTRKRIVAFLGGEIVLFGIIIFVSIALSSNSISNWDVAAADSSTVELNVDTTNINTDIKAMVAATNVLSLNTTSSAISRQISDAQKQYNLLSTSPALKNKAVASHFADVKTAWTRYISFVQGTVADYKNLGPVLVDLTNSQQSLLAASRQSSSNLSAELKQ
jgi:hypothetical protein